MDLSQMLIESLLGNSSLNVLSKNSGVGKDQTKEIVANALPLILKNMQENASNKDGEEALAKALEYHAKSNTNDVSAFLKNADIDDGNKILTHILGGKKKKVEADLAKKAGVTTTQSSNILANIAPLLLSLVGIQAKQKSVAGGLGPLLASVLLGGSSGAKGGGGRGLEELILGSLTSVLTGQKSDNIVDGLIGSLFGTSGKEK